MREIKFRGLRTDGQGWVYGYYYQYNGQDIICYENHSDSADTYHYEPVLPESVGQFTGLKDINGTDIYEGDVMNGIQREQCDKEGENAYKVTERVVFNRGSFKVFGKHISDGHTRDNNCLYQFMWVETWGNIISSEKYFQIDEIEVIGNIHQNPELL